MPWVDVMSSKRLIELLLGPDDAGNLTSGLPDDLPGSIVRRSLAGSFGELTGEAGMAVLLRALDDSVLTRPPGTGHDKSTICRTLYDRLRAGAEKPGASFDRFEAAFDRFIAALRDGLVQAAEPELIDTPCRGLGRLNLDELSRMQVPDELYYHMTYLVAYFLDRESISASDAGFVIDLVDKMVSAPGYLRFLGEDKKREEMAQLLGIAAAVRSSRVHPEAVRHDMIVTLGLLLYNISPSEKAAAVLASIQPSAACRALQYHYNAILALNYVLTGRLDRASQHAAVARRSADDPGMLAYILILEGCIAIGQGDPGQAIELLETAGVRAPDGRTKALAFFYRGLVFSEKREYENAIGCFREAGAHVTDPLDRATIYNNIGSCASYHGDLSLAEQSFATMEKLSGHLSGDTTLQCRLVASSRSGALLRARGDYAGAIERYRQALQLALRSGDTTAIANQMGSLGVAYALAGDSTKAFQLLNACLAYAERTGYWAGIRFAYWHIRRMLQENGNHSEARKFLETYVARYPELRNLK